MNNIFFSKRIDFSVFKTIKDIYHKNIMNKRKRKGYENKYNSWMSSQFKNFESRSNTLDQISSTSFTEERHDVPLRDEKGRRIITRDSLYEDPDLFIFFLGSDHKLERQLQGWVRSGEETYTLDHIKCEITDKKHNKIEKNLNKMLAKPVQITKAARMMEKMGWQGGALGKHGEGIIEPITPNASYATKTIGLGETAKRPKSAKKFKGFDKKREKEYFDTNVLLHVLDFVKNDSENEIVFHHCLGRKERKWVHNVVEALANNNQAVTTDFDTIAQMDIVQEILKYNSLLLITESEGVFPDRFLCLYKEAPENMYLVTPDDLNQDDVDNSGEMDKNTLNKETKKTNKDSTHNGTINTKKGMIASVDEVLISITEYFTEFVEDDNYTEFRFLGPFNDQEIDAINIFINKCTHNDFNTNELLINVFKNNTVVMKENFNGNIIFCKSSKNP